MSRPQEIRWLLRDKYDWPEQRILSALNGWSGAVTELPTEIHADLNRLEKGEPLAYVIGWTPFLDLKIDLSYKTLIPRPETEYWVSQFLQQHQDKKTANTPIKVLDLCCGSGCIGATVLKYWPMSQVDFVDIEHKAIEQTQLNLRKNNLPTSRWQLLQSDLFTAVTDHYDFILSNPPYLDPFADFSPSLLHEPTESLFAQKSGIKLIEEVVLKAKNHLKTGGELWLEFGQGQAKQIKKLAKRVGFSITICEDQFGRERYACAQLSACSSL